MALSYPLSMPATPGFAAIAWRRVGVVGVAASPFTGQRQTYAWPGQWWEVDVTLPPMRSADVARPWVAWLVGLNGQEGSFLLGDSVHTAPRGVGTGTPLVNGGSQTGYDLVTDGWTAGQSNIMRAGDWVQLGTGASSRLHMVMTDVSSNGSGGSTLTLWPALRTSPADNAALTVSACKGLFALTGNGDGWGNEERKIYEGFRFTAREVLT